MLTLQLLEVPSSYASPAIGNRDSYVRFSTLRSGSQSLDLAPLSDKTLPVKCAAVGPPIVSCGVVDVECLRCLLDLDLESIGQLCFSVSG